MRKIQCMGPHAWPHNSNPKADSGLLAARYNVLFFGSYLRIMRSNNLRMEIFLRDMATLRNLRVSFCQDRRVKKIFMVWTGFAQLSILSHIFFLTYFFSIHFYIFLSNIFSHFGLRLTTWDQESYVLLTEPSRLPFPSIFRLKCYKIH